MVQGEESTKMKRIIRLPQTSSGRLDLAFSVAWMPSGQLRQHSHRSPRSSAPTMVRSRTAHCSPVQSPHCDEVLKVWCDGWANREKSPEILQATSQRASRAPD